MEHIHVEIERLLTSVNDLLDKLCKYNDETCVLEITDLVSQFRNDLSVHLLKPTDTYDDPNDMEVKPNDSDLDDEDLLNQMEEMQKDDEMNLNANEILKIKHEVLPDSKQ